MTRCGWRTRRAGWVRDELARLREDMWAQDGDRLAGQLAAVARQLAENAADLAGAAGHRAGDGGRPAVRPGDAAAQEAGFAALRDLVAGSRMAGQAAGWLEPGDFATAEQGAVFEAITDLRRCGLPLDPVTVCWEASRRGADVDLRSLAGGCGAFAGANLAQVYRRAVLARLDRAGLDLQSGAADRGLTVGRLFRDAGERLIGAEHDLAPQRCRVPARSTEVVALRAERAASQVTAGPVAERGLEAAP